MPLPDLPTRTELHIRRIELRGYCRGDGLYEIDGRVVDTKTYSVRHYGSDEETAAGAPIHDMWIRLVIDEELVVKDLLAVMDASPFRVCREAVAPMAQIIGERIKPGWTNMVKERLGGATGCTHLMELMIPLATAAYQTLGSARIQRPNAIAKAGVPAKIDSCYAYASHRDVVKRCWPAFYTGALSNPGKQEGTSNAKSNGK